MNTRAINAASGVILAAQQQSRLAAGIALALDAAGLLNSPEHAAEHAELRRQRNAFRDQRNAVFATNAELLARAEESDLARLNAENEARKLTHANRALRERLAELEDERAETRPVDEDPIGYALTPKAAVAMDVAPQVRKLRALLAGQRQQTGGA